MDIKQAQSIVRDTLQNTFDKARFIRFIKELLNHIDESPFIYRGNLIPDAYDKFISTFERIGKYTDGENKLDILIVNLKKESSIERARSMQRNFIAWYLNGSRGGELKDAALVAFVSPNQDDWRFSLVKMDYKFEEGKNGRVRVKEEFTPARRWSFLVGKNENSHTAQSKLAPVIEDEGVITSKQLEEAFNIEVVTKEFFEKYRELFHSIQESMDAILKKESKIKAEFKERKITSVDFAKKLLGQIVFLYFLQKKGWFGVERDAYWGTGPKNFLRLLFEQKIVKYNNFFNDILEPLFYEALNKERDDDFYSKLNCKIPFLNGELFDPIKEYDWIHTDILLSEDIFSNKERAKQGDIGTGILDVFDRYNFTVKEDEPLEKDVAIDPEMLGKVFENLLKVKDRKSKGTYYTPREIVHYMCQESLVNYLKTECKEKISEEDIRFLIQFGESAVEHDTIYIDKKSKKEKTKVYGQAKLPKSIEKYSELLDKSLANIRVCDPAIGSGAFPVGMMNEIIRTRNALTNFIKNKRDRTIYEFKRQAVQDCLYGVDINLAAVEIAKLRLWLSLVVDEDDIKRIKPLPNLDFKIVQGDSLLGVERDVLNYPKFNELEKLKPLYFDATNLKKKREYKKKIDTLIKEISNNNHNFDFEVYFSEVFREKGGFDVVIANPPYVSAIEAKKTISAEERESYKTRFSSAKGTYDLYVIFFELGLRLLKEDGVLTYISPSKYLSAKYAEALRSFILRYTLLQLVDFSQLRAFESAAVSTLISIIKKGEGGEPIRTLKLFDLHDWNHRQILENKRQYLTLFPENIWGFLLSNHVELIKKIWEKSVPMAEVAQVGASSTASEADEYSNYISDKKSTESMKIINTKTIDHVFNHWGRIAYKNKNGNIQEPYIDISAINSRRREIYKQKKLIFSKVALSITSSYDREGEFASTNTNLIYNPSNLTLDFLAAYTNSKFADFLYKQLFGGLNMFSSYQFQSPQLRILPVPPKVSNNRDFSNTIDKILSIAKSADYLDSPTKQAKVKEYEKQIDQLVYKLYGLTPDEVKIVENSGQ